MKSLASAQKLPPTSQVAELKAELRSRGLSLKGKKQDLVQRLQEAEAGMHFEFLSARLCGLRSTLFSHGYRVVLNPKP